MADPPDASNSAPESPPTPPPPGLRIALYFLFVVVILYDLGTWLLFWWLHGAPEGPPTSGEPMPTRTIGWLLAVRALIAPSVIVATIGFVHFLDRKSTREIGAALPERKSDWWMASLSLVVLGIWTVGVSILAETDLTPRTLLPGEFGEILGLCAGFLIAACVDEWIFRGYIFSALRERFPWAHAAGLSAFLSAWLHAANPEVGPAILINMFLLGLVMAAIRELSGSLWTTALFHGLWNLSIACILSLPLSGMPMIGLLHAELRGDEIWTGGSYGPEASWLLGGALLVVLLSLGPNLEALAKDENDENDENNENAQNSSTRDDTEPR